MERFLAKLRSHAAVSTLETAAILVIILPIITGAVALIDYINTLRQVRQQLDFQMNKVDTATLRIGSGVQDFWLRPLWTQTVANLETIADSAEESIQTSLGLTDPRTYAIELGMVTLTINKQTGAVTGISAQAGSDYLHVATRGTFVPPGQSLQDTLRALPDAPNHQRHLEPIFALPNAIHGTRIQAHYGPSHIFGYASNTNYDRVYKNQYPIADYLRSAEVLGVRLSIDISAGFTGQTLVPLGVRSYITDLRLASPRQDFAGPVTSGHDDQPDDER